MPVITWKHEMSVGVHAIDTDHKLLISLINQLHDAVEDGLGEETVGSVLNALCDYTAYHFGREEALMEAVGYPDLAGHKKTHDALSKKVFEIRDQFVTGKSKKLSDEVLDFMKNWLTDHIMGRDRQYIPMMAGKTDVIERANHAFTERLAVEADDIEDSKPIFQ